MRLSHVMVRAGVLAGLGAALVVSTATFDDVRGPQPIAVDTLAQREATSAARSAVRTVEVEVLDGERRSVTPVASGATVAAALTAAGVVLDEHDQVTPSVDTVASDAAVKVLRATPRVEVITQKVAPKTIKVKDSDLLVGKERELDPGRAGTSTQTFIVHELADGTEVARDVVATTTTDAVARRVAVGSRNPVKVASGPVSTKGNRALGKEMAAARGWGASQFACLEKLWTRESGWNHKAANPSSGAYGIPQSLPGSKMASAGADWRSNPATQIKWGLGYIANRHGTPCGALDHSYARGWY